MTWTYDVTTLSTDTTAQVRFLVGDTDSSDQLITDEEVDYAITEEGSTRSAAAMVADALAAEFARKADKQVGQLRIDLSQKAEAYAALAIRLRARSASLALPTMGGISISRKETVEADTDRVEPAFFTGMMSNPDATSAEST